MFKLGWAVGDISPREDCSLLGYSFRQQKLPSGHAGVDLPLRASVLVLEQAESRVVWVALDLCVLPIPMARHVRQLVATAARVDTEQVMLFCSHTHSGPFPLFDALEEHEPLLEGFVDPRSREASRNYGRELQMVLRTLTAQACGLRVPVEAFYREAPLGLAYTRRVPEGDGVRLCWNPQESPELRLTVTADPTCGCLVFRQIQGPGEWVVWNYGAHPVTLGKTSRVVSGDWPGYACRTLEESRPGRQAMFLLGACGDTHPWLATQPEPDMARRLGRAVGAFVDILSLSAPERVSGSPGALRIESQTWSRGAVELDISWCELGQVGILALPVELFAQGGAELRRKIARPLLLATNANGWTGYWPGEADFSRGGYEIDAARSAGRKSGDAEWLIEELAAWVK